MKLQIFLSKNKIKISKKSLKLCEEAKLLMTKSMDPIHDNKHIENMLENLNLLLNKEKELKKRINFEVLLLSLFWHDVWNSRQKVSDFVVLIKNQIVEGMRSGSLFWARASKMKLDKKIAYNTYYVIRKHSSFQLFPPATLEAKILVDLDKIELWNSVRLFKTKELYVSNKAFYQKYIVRLYFYYSYKLGLYFSSLNGKLELYAQKFWRETGLTK